MLATDGSHYWALQSTFMEANCNEATLSGPIGSPQKLAELDTLHLQNLEASSVPGGREGAIAVGTMPSESFRPAASHSSPSYVCIHIYIFVCVYIYIYVYIRY